MAYLGDLGVRGFAGCVDWTALSPTLSPVRPVAMLRRDHNENGGFAKGTLRTGFHPETMKSATWLGWCLEELKQRDREVSLKPCHHCQCQVVS